MATTALRLDDLVVAQQSDTQQVIGWRLVGIGPLVATAVVELSRSYVENDGYELIATVPASQIFYEDSTVNLYDRWRVPFYKLRLVDTTGAYRDYGPIRVSGELDGITRSIIRNARTQLRIGAGNPVLFYQRRFDTSQRCPDCWDPVMKQVVLSDCLSCYNTGFVGGFHSPVLTLASITPESKADQTTDRTEQNTGIQGMTINFPILRSRDFMYEVDTGRRYRIVTVQPGEKNRMLASQVFTAEAIHPGDIEHRVPVPSVDQLAPVISRFRAPRRSMLTQSESPGADSIIGHIVI